MSDNEKQITAEDLLRLLLSKPDVRSLTERVAKLEGRLDAWGTVAKVVSSALAILGAAAIGLYVSSTP